MFEFLARETYQRRWFFLTAGLVVLLIGIFYGVNVFDSLKSGGLTDESSGSAREERQLAEMFPKSRVSLILLVKSPTLTIDQPAFRMALKRILNSAAADSSKPAVTSYLDAHDAQFVSRDHHSTFALVAIPGDDSDAYMRIRQHIPTTGLQVDFGGPMVADYEINAAVQRDLPKAGAISVPILAVLLILIFRSLIAVSLPLLIGALSVLGAFALTRLVATQTDISIFAANIISLLGFGLAIDYSLLFVSRFRDEIASGKDVAASIATCVKTAGESIFLSGSTVALSLLGLLIFPEPFLRSMGIGGALAVLMAMVSSLTVLPAILSVTGPWINRIAVPLPKPPGAVSTYGAMFWNRFAHLVIRCAVPVIVVVLGALIGLGAPFLHVRFADLGTESLPEGFQTRTTSEALSRDFSASQNPPIEAIVNLPTWPTNPTEINNLSHYVAQLRKLSGVRKVTSLVSVDPRIPRAAYAQFYAQQRNPKAVAAKARFVSGYSTLITIDYWGDKESEANQKLVAAVRAVPPPPESFVLVGGDTADLVDRLDSLYSHIPIAVTAILAATFLLLLFMLSSVVIPLKAILLNTLSLCAAFGLMTWIFQDGHLQKLLRFTSSGALDPTLPVLIFAIAFGLATDYEVFLVSRIKEEYMRSRDNTTAIVIGVEKTGGIITSAGLLLIVVVAAFGMSEVLPMKEMGVGLAVAVTIDALIVRTFLVPAAMALFGKSNWWIPRFSRSNRAQAKS